MSSDPRILQPEGKTVYVATSRRRGDSSKYHREGCDDLDKMKDDPKPKDVSIPKWKGYEPCSHCFDIDTEENACKLTGEDVDRVRRSLVSGATCGELADRYGVSATTIADHAKRGLNFTYNEKPSLPPVTYNGTWEHQ